MGPPASRRSTARACAALALAVSAAARADPEPAPPTPSPTPTPAFEGRVLARGTRSPIPGAHLVVRPEGGGAPIEVETDEHGAFAIPDLPPGRYLATVTAERTDRAGFPFTVAAAGSRKPLTWYVALTWAARYETTVRNQPRRVEIAHNLATEELSRIPGTFGDPLRAVENLPGVARAPFNTGLFIIRGGKPTDSRSFFAGSEVPQLYHFGGFTSVFPANLLDKIDYYPGNFGVRYGRSTAGVVDLDLRAGKTDRLHGSLETNAFDAGATMEGPVGKGSFFLGARRSYVDLILKGVESTSLFSGSPVAFTTAPVYYDYQAILDYPLGGGRLRLAVFGSDDDLRLLFDRPAGDDPALAGAFETHILFHRLQARFTRTVGSVAVLAQISTGYNGQSGALGHDLSFDIRSFASDARLEARWKYSDRLSFLVGGDSQFAYVDLAANIPAPPSEGQLPLPLSATTHYRADEQLKIFNGGAYAEATWKPPGLRDRLTLTPGLRLDYYSPLAHLSFDPRLNARLDVAAYTTLKLGIGRYSQDPQPPDYDRVFGNPKLRPESAIHYALTVEQGLYPGLSLSLTGFYKQLDDLVVSSQAQIVTSDGKITAEKKSNDGEGRVYGGEVMLRQAMSKWLFGWISYTLMRSERRSCAGCAWRIFDFDQTHVLILALSFNLPRGFGAGLRFRYISGYPYTRALGGQFDSDGAVYTPGVVPVNAGRLAAFHQLDLRVDKTFVYQRWQLKVYLDVSNVYNHLSEEQVQYSFDYTRRTPITGLPIIPSFGLRAEF